MDEVSVSIGIVAFAELKDLEFFRGREGRRRTSSSTSAARDQSSRHPEYGQRQED
jgi:hypothetical protein